MRLSYGTVLLLSVALAVALYGGSAEASNDPPPHNTFSWDYGDNLGEASGWWGMWFPTCKMPNQSPIDIDTSTVVEALDSVLVVRPVNGRPIDALDTIVSYNNSFNYVRCDFGAEELEMYIYWDDGTEVADEDRVLYELDQYTFRFPSEHEIDGEMLTAELRYTFSPPLTWPLDEEMAIDDVLDNKTTVAISVLFKEVPDVDVDPVFDHFFKSVMNGYESGATRARPYIPPFKSLYQYKGSQTTPPCRGNVQYFIGSEVIPIGASTMKRFRVYGPNWADYRLVKPLDGRVVREVSYRPEGLAPKFRTTPNPVKYVENGERLSYNKVALHYAVVMIGCLCGVLALAIVWLLCERFTYQPPYNMTWDDCNTKREVFGVEVRYSQVSGRPEALGTSRLMGAEYAMGFDDGEQDAERVIVVASAISHVKPSKVLECDSASIRESTHGNDDTTDIKDGK